MQTSNDSSQRKWNLFLHVEKNMYLEKASDNISADEKDTVGHGHALYILWVKVKLMITMLIGTKQREKDDSPQCTTSVAQAFMALIVTLRRSYYLNYFPLLTIMVLNSATLGVRVKISLRIFIYVAFKEFISKFHDVADVVV